MGLEIFGLGVLIAYTTFAALQWSANKKAADAAKTAADTSTDTLKLYRETAARQYGTADVQLNGVSIVYGNGTVSAGIVVQNDGRQDARGISVCASVSKSQAREIGKCEHPIPTIPQLLLGSDNLPKGTRPETALIDSSFITAQIQSRDSGEIWACGTISYFDYRNMESPNRVPFCKHVSAQILFGANPGPNRGGVWCPKDDICRKP
jgi:hypothetical protein